MDYSETDLLSPETWLWLIKIAIGVGIAIVLSLVLRRIVAVLKKKTAHSDKTWKRRLHKITHLPLQLAIWGFAVSYVIDVVGSHFGLDHIAKYVIPIRTAFIVACISWIVLRWIKEAFRHLAKKSERLGVATGTIYALQKLTSFVFVILVLMIIFQIFSINILPLLAFGGIGVAGVAFAAQDFIANFFGGAMLHFTRTFSIGDEIVIPSQSNFEGEVREIGWYTTVVEDYYRRPVYFPNALFSKAHVINESRRTHRRIKERMAIRYEDAPVLEQIVEDLRVEIAAHPDIDNTQSFAITFDSFADSGLEIYFYMLVYRVGYVRFLSVRQEILLIAQSVIDRHGAEFCYPTQMIHLAQPLNKGERG